MSCNLSFIYDSGAEFLYFFWGKKKNGGIMELAVETESHIYFSYIFQAPNKTLIFLKIFFKHQIQMWIFY